MDHILTLAIILEVAGLFLLVGDLFVPSHGAMTIIALGCLIAGIFQAFRFSELAGFVSLTLCLIVLPLFAMLAVRVWPRTYVGRRVAPPNRPFDTSDSPASGRELSNLLGQIGTALTPLRPVGTCDFGGKRVESVAESGMIEPGMKVTAVSVQGLSLVVRPAGTADKSARDLANQQS